MDFFQFELTTTKNRKLYILQIRFPPLVLSLENIYSEWKNNPALQMIYINGAYFLCVLKVVLVIRQQSPLAVALTVIQTTSLCQCKIYVCSFL